MKFVYILLFLFLTCSIHGQQSALTSGGNASGSGGTVSYSVGQVVYTTNKEINGSVEQGVQLPYELSVVTGLKEAKDITLELFVYPNPASDFVKLVIPNYEIENIRFQLYNNNGILLQDKKVERSETSIVMSNLFPSIYFLKVTSNNKVIKTFKIIKK